MATASIVILLGLTLAGCGDSTSSCGDLPRLESELSDELRQPDVNEVRAQVLQMMIDEARADCEDAR